MKKIKRFILLAVLAAMAPLLPRPSSLLMSHLRSWLRPS